MIIIIINAFWDCLFSSKKENETKTEAEFQTYHLGIYDFNG